jgi:hypothetical protein
LDPAQGTIEGLRPAFDFSASLCFDIRITEGAKAREWIPLTALWLPILVSAAIVFFASFIMHMVLTYHKSDYRKLPDEGRVSGAMRGMGLIPRPPTSFHIFRSPEMKSVPVSEKMKRGPVGLLTVLPSGPPAMGKNLIQWFLYCLVMSVFAAYLSGRLLAPGTAFLQVFRVVGTVAWLGYGSAHVQESIWSGRSWVVTLKHRFDSVIYELLTAGTFGWL